MPTSAPAFIGSLLAAPGHDYNLSAPGEISTGGSGEFSTGANWGIFNRH
jgi:hypothetical protein